MIESVCVSTGKSWSSDDVFEFRTSSEEGSEGGFKDGGDDGGDGIGFEWWIIVIIVASPVLLLGVLAVVFARRRRHRHKYEFRNTPHQSNLTRSKGRGASRDDKFNDFESVEQLVV